MHDSKPSIVNQQSIVYYFKCDLCDDDHVGYTCGHLHERVEGHKKKTSLICKHYIREYNSKILERLIKQVNVLAKCGSKFDCLVKEMLLIKNFTSLLNV